MIIKDILSNKGYKVYTIGLKQTVHSAIQILVEHNIGALLVLDDKGKLVGVISERDILRESATRDQKLRETKVKDVMTKDVIIGLPDDEAGYTLGIMTKNRIRHLPVMEADKIAGIISLGDIVNARLNKEEYDNRYLKQYMFGSDPTLTAQDEPSKKT